MTSMLAAAVPDISSLPRGPFNDASNLAELSDLAFWVITWICVVFFVAIVGVMLWFMWKYRRVSHVADTGGPTHHTPLEVTWTVLPLILVIGIFYVGMRGYVKMRVPPANTYDVQVTGQKWSWTFQHPNGAVNSEILHVPLGRPVKLVMGSQDVLHSLFIPAFRVKQDVVPGRYTTLWFTPTAQGTYDLYCAEYCGTNHSDMVARVAVWPEEEFQAVIKEEAEWIKGVAEEDLWWKAGPRLYNRCASCHTLDGSPSTGPSFAETNLLLRNGPKRPGESDPPDPEKRRVARVFTNGQVLADLIGREPGYASVEDYVLQSIYFPQEHVIDGFPPSMPTFRGQLDEKERRAMLQFIAHLNKFTFGPNGEIIPPEDIVKAAEERDAATNETDPQAQP